MITKLPHDLRPHAAHEPGKGYKNTIYMVSDFNTQEKRWPSSEHLHSRSRSSSGTSTVICNTKSSAKQQQTEGQWTRRALHQPQSLRNITTVTIVCKWQVVGLPPWARACPGPVQGLSNENIWQEKMLLLPPFVFCTLLLRCLHLLQQEVGICILCALSLH